MERILQQPQTCEAAHERKRAKDQLKIERSSKKINKGARVNTPIDSLVEAIETRPEKIRYIIGYINGNEYRQQRYA